MECDALAPCISLKMYIIIRSEGALEHDRLHEIMLGRTNINDQIYFF